LSVLDGDCVTSLDHRGLIVMAASGKAGYRLVLMNSVIRASASSCKVCAREGVKAVLHDSEFSPLLEALPTDVPRVLTRVDDDADPPAGVQTIDDVIAANSSEPLPTPSTPGCSVILTSVHDRAAEGMRPEQRCRHWAPRR
jgi:fatty-acyl-CoA synthase